MSDETEGPKMGGWMMRHEIELIELANTDPVAALELLDSLAERSVSVSAEVALHVAAKCLLAKPPKVMGKPGRPPRTVEDTIDRLTDGKALCDGEGPKRARSERDEERCKAEWREWLKNLPPETP